MKEPIKQVIINSIDTSVHIKDQPFTSLEQAKQLLRQFRPGPSDKDPDCVKVHFTVVWENGAQFKGRLDMEKGLPQIGKPYHIEDVIHNWFMFYTGLPLTFATKEMQKYMIEQKAPDAPEELMLGSIHFLLTYEHGIDLGRELSAEELADLSSEWENPTVDCRHYYQSVMTTWEVTEQTYTHYKKLGGLCQAYRDKFYIA
jgi:hypothetical protein